MALSRQERSRRKVDLNPLEMIEKVVSANDWPFDRTSDREIAVEVAGRWCDYRMFFSWREDVEALHFTCAYDVRIPTERHNDGAPIPDNCNNCGLCSAPAHSKTSRFACAVRSSPRWR